MAGERRLYLERNCRLPESPAHSRRRNREGPASSKGLHSQRGFGPAVEPRRKSRPRSTSLHGSSPCKCQRLSTLRWDRLPPSRPSTKSGARAGGRRLSDRRLHRWLAGTSASAPSSHGAADLLGLNRAHICVRNHQSNGMNSPAPSDDGYRFPAAIIAHAVWIYCRFSLSFRDVEDLLAQRGITVTYETIRQWCCTFGHAYARRLRQRPGRLGATRGLSTNSSWRSRAGKNTGLSGFPNAILGPFGVFRG